MVRIEAMARRKNLNALLHNFLGTFVSRYSYFDGYWIFGFLVEKDLPISINLLMVYAPSNSPVGVIRRIAIDKFQRQALNNCVDLNRITEASVDIIKVSDAFVHGRKGSVVEVQVCGRIDTYPLRCLSTQFFVAPHSALREYRSAELQ